jgi:hypothetical protein
MRRSSAWCTLVTTSRIEALRTSVFAIAITMLFITLLPAAKVPGPTEVEGDGATAIRRA